MTIDICKLCRRQFAVDDWDNSPEFVQVCGTRYKDPEEDATAEIECRDFTISSLMVRLREAGDRQRAWGIERATHERTNGNLRARAERAEAELAEEREMCSLSDMRYEAEIAQLKQRLEREKELCDEIYQSERRVFAQCNERIVELETQLRKAVSNG